MQARMPAPQDIAAFSEPPLQAGSCVLRRRDVAVIVQDALLYFQGQRYRLGAWCIMPNHVHMVVQPLPGYQLSDILHSWKSFTATKITRLLNSRGPLWERESFDYLIRRPAHIAYFTAYIENTPVLAGFCASPGDWPFSSVVRPKSINITGWERYIW
jgi:putative DNA methylase